MAANDAVTLVPATSLARATLPLDDDEALDAAPIVGPRFRLLREVGRGGLGEVYVADDRDIGRQVAIKRIRVDARSDAAVGRFVREVRTTGQLDHPNIVPLHDVGRDDDGTYYYVMKYLEGESLEALIERLRQGDRAAHAQWTFERRVALFRDVLAAIRFAHARGIVHRDIKPANVMVGANGEVTVVDWGLAKELGTGGEVPAPARAADGRSSSETRHGALLGTPLYMAPEQARGEPADARTDAWQLALLLYELLTLRHYLEGETVVELILVEVLERPIPNPRSVRSPHQPPVPTELANLVMAGLRRDPAARATVEELLTALDRRDEGDFDVVDAR
ncbi:MAG: serine/threonine-protein kinase [Bryobacterales bacterium]